MRGWASVPACGGKLDLANYKRKLRGQSSVIGELAICYSLCCRRDGCRHRVRVSSVRFLGRSPYEMALQLILCHLLNGKTIEAKVLGKTYDVSEKTLYRWQKWWQELTKKSFWKLFAHQLSAYSLLLPSGLFDKHQDDVALENLLKILRFLSQLREHIP